MPSKEITKSDDRYRQREIEKQRMTERESDRKRESERERDRQTETERVWKENLCLMIMLKYYCRMMGRKHGR